MWLLRRWLTVNCWSLDSAVSFMVFSCRSQPRAAAGTWHHFPRCAAHRTAATDLPSANSAAGRQFAREASPSTAVAGGGDPSGSGNNSPPAVSHFFPNSFFFSFLHLLTYYPLLTRMLLLPCPWVLRLRLRVFRVFSVRVLVDVVVPRETRETRPAPRTGSRGLRNASPS